jgi:multiple sugar transport system permease protein
VARSSRPKLAPIGFLLPFGVPFALFFVLPICYAIYESLYRVQQTKLYGGGGQTVFAGVANYAQAINDTNFVHSVLRVLLFAAVEVPVMIVVPLALALLLESMSARWPQIFRGFYFMPFGVPGVIASLLWGFLYVPGISPIVDIFAALGLPHDFLGAGSVLWSIANIVTWQFAGYNMLILIAQLKAISGDLYEAARIDGAGAWKTIWYIKLPLVRPALVLTTVFTIIGTIQLFAEPLVLQPNSGAITSHYTPNLTAYTEAFQNNNYNLAAAEATLLALAAVVLSFGFLELVGRGSRR